MPLLVAALFWPRATGAGALAGLLGGAALSTLFVAPALRPFPVHAGLYGVALNVALLVGVSLATRASPAGAAFVADAATEDVHSAS